MSKEEDYKIIETYLLGQLSDAEAKAFEVRCESDAAFKKMFLSEQEFFNALEVEGNLEMKAVLQGLESQHQAKIIQMNPRRKMLRLIAGFLFFPLCFFLFKTMSSPSNHDLFSDNYSIYPNELVHIDRGSENSSDLKKTMIEYSSGNFEEAIKNFDLMLGTEQKQDILFYKAVSLLGEGKSKEALNTFDKIDLNNDFKFTEAYRWYKALALVNENNISGAKEELNQIISSGQKFRRESAEKLLSELGQE